MEQYILEPTALYTVHVSRLVRFTLQIFKSGRHKNSVLNRIKYNFN
jgi:hypothetical protein